MQQRMASLQTERRDQTINRLANGVAFAPQRAEISGGRYRDIRTAGFKNFQLKKLSLHLSE